MANLGSIGQSGMEQKSVSYPFPTSGLGKIEGTVQENGSSLTGKVLLIDETQSYVVDAAFGSTFSFKGINLSRKYTVVCQDPTNTNFNSLIYDRVVPAAL
jgi:hypothetical protein